MAANIPHVFITPAGGPATFQTCNYVDEEVQTDFETMSGLDVEVVDADLADDEGHNHLQEVLSSQYRNDDNLSQLESMISEVLEKCDLILLQASAPNLGSSSTENIEYGANLIESVAAGNALVRRVAERLSKNYVDTQASAVARHKKVLSLGHDIRAVTESQRKTRDVVIAGLTESQNQAQLIADVQLRPLIEGLSRQLQASQTEHAQLLASTRAQLQADLEAMQVQLRPSKYRWLLSVCYQLVYPVLLLGLGAGYRLEVDLASASPWA
jgi:hypothetical protein